MTVYTIGIDISKARLQAHRLPDGVSRRFSNDRSGFRQLKKWLQGLTVERLVYEATGTYHRAFERSMAADGLPLCRVHAVAARRFAQSKGNGTKTDPIDAFMLAAMGIAHQPPLTELPDEALRDLQAFMAARQVLVDDRTAIGNRLEALAATHGTTPNACAKELRRLARHRLAQISRQLAAIDDLLEQLLAAHPKIEAKHRILASIPAIGWHTAILMLAEMPELGTLSGAQAGCLSGLAPITRESGKWQGKSFVQGGRKTVRKALYMPALVAIQHNPSLKAKYRAFKAAGKPSKVALVAIMRKLVLMANALLRDGRMWSEKAPCA